MNRRALWLPKLKELPQQCASCPFLEGNDEEFMVILKRLAKLHHKRPPKTTHLARCMVYEDIRYSGDFVCHGSVYDAEMNFRHVREHRQCPGASKAFREAGEE